MRYFAPILLIYPAWLAMMATHESGHALHAWLSGGTVDHISIPLMGFSHTEVGANPHPAIVAWGGPIWGCLIPFIAWGLSQPLHRLIRSAMQFFAGFCLIVNGAYIGVGWRFDAGDAADLLRHGTPAWFLVLCGCLAMGGGLHLWHRLDGRRVSPR